MNTRHKLVRLGSILLVALAGCSSGSGTTSPKTPAPPISVAASPAATKSSEPSPAAPQDIRKLEDFAPLDPGIYFIDPDADPSTPLRVVYEVPAEGWSAGEGAVKFAADGVGHVEVTITNVTNVVQQGCHDHRLADPSVGPSVDDLATALANLAPFRVTSAPEDVNVYGYSGKHLAWIVPNLPVEGPANGLQFKGCVSGDLKSWDSNGANDPFYGYTGPGYREEFWILDVDGTRLVISDGRSAGSPAEARAELRAILDSIRIEP
jgi:hypothetical protein